MFPTAKNKGNYEEKYMKDIKYQNMKTLVFWTHHKRGQFISTVTIHAIASSLSFLLYNHRSVIYKFTSVKFSC